MGYMVGFYLTEYLMTIYKYDTSTQIDIYRACLASFLWFILLRVLLWKIIENWRKNCERLLEFGGALALSSSHSKDTFPIVAPTSPDVAEKIWNISHSPLKYETSHLYPAPAPPIPQVPGPLPAQSILSDMATDGTRVHYVDLTPPNNMKHTTSKLWYNLNMD